MKKINFASSNTLGPTQIKILTSLKKNGSQTLLELRQVTPRAFTAVRALIERELVNEVINDAGEVRFTLNGRVAHGIAAKILKIKADDTVRFIVGNVKKRNEELSLYTATYGHIR